MFDRLDSQFDFLAQFSPNVGFVTLTWASVPGKKYLLEYTDALTAAWQPFTARQTAPAGAASMSFQDPGASGRSSRFCRVTLVP